MKSLLRSALLLIAFPALAACAYAAAPTSPVPYAVALAEAQKVAALNPAWTVMRCDGDSMTPYFGDASLMLVQPSRVSELRPGMIAVYRDAAGDLVAHSVVKVDASGATLRGFNNTRNDPDVVTDANLAGVVFGFLHSAGGDDATSAAALPLAVGKRM